MTDITERERLARIIDPENFAKFDRMMKTASRGTFSGGEALTEYQVKATREDAAGLIKDALAKAGRYLSPRPPWRVMTQEEFATLRIKGRVTVERDFDSAGNVAVWLDGHTQPPPSSESEREGLDARTVALRFMAVWYEWDGDLEPWWAALDDEQRSRAVRAALATRPSTVDGGVAYTDTDGVEHHGVRAVLEQAADIRAELGLIANIQDDQSVANAAEQVDGLIANLRALRHSTVDAALVERVKAQIKRREDLAVHYDGLAKAGIEPDTLESSAREQRQAAADLRALLSAQGLKDEGKQGG